MAYPARSEQTRPYAVKDQPAIEALVDADSDRLWLAQGHRLHGEPRDGPQWRRTLVTEAAGRVIGAVTVSRNRVHPGRYNLAVEVGAAWRGNGVGRRLIEQAARLAPEPLPLSAKVRPSDAPGVALLHRLGGRVYQRCSGLCPAPSSADVRAWAAAHASAPGAEVLALADRPRHEWADLWVRQYLWVHQEWSPAAEGPLRGLAQGLIDEVDADSTSIAVRDGRVNAVAWVFGGPDATAELVAETVHAQAPAGITDVAACLARSVLKLAQRGVRSAEIDGHISDPHLQPVLDTFPEVPREPLDLVEIEIDPAGRSDQLRPA